MRLQTLQTFDRSDVYTKRQKDKKTKRQKDKKTERQKDRKTEKQKEKKTKGQKDKRQIPKREFSIATSGQFRTLAMFLRESKHLKGHLATRVSNVTLFNQALRGNM